MIEQCESGGRNVPNASGSSASGFYQITKGTLASLGGSGSAMNYSRAEQRRFAEKLLATRGTQPWNASRSCWGGKSSAVAPRKATSQRAAKSSVKAQKSTAKARHRSATSPRHALRDTTVPRHALGVRGPDGRGIYRCSPSTLFFEDCDRSNLGQVVRFPKYDR